MVSKTEKNVKKYMLHLLGVNLSNEQQQSRLSRINHRQGLGPSVISKHILPGEIWMLGCGGSVCVYLCSAAGDDFLVNLTLACNQWCRPRPAGCCSTATRYHHCC